VSAAATTAEAWLAAHGATTEPDWGDLQDAYRTLRDYGYTMARRRCGGILVDGHRMQPHQVRRMADKLRAGKMRWQGGGAA